MWNVLGNSAFKSGLAVCVGGEGGRGGGLNYFSDEKVARAAIPRWFPGRGDIVPEPPLDPSVGTLPTWRRGWAGGTYRRCLSWHQRRCCFPLQGHLLDGSLERRR